MEKKITSHLTKGLIISLILIVLDLIAGFAGFKFNPAYRWVPTLILCVAIIITCINYANQKNNAVTFGNVFAHGFKTTAVITCITFIYTLLAIYVIFPEMKTIVLDEARKNMEANGKLSDEQIDQAISLTERMFIPFALAGVILGTLIAGAIASLLGAAFAKKNPPAPFQNTNI